VSYTEIMNDERETLKWPAGLSGDCGNHRRKAHGWQTL
jgi:hypothetical protein